MPVVVFPSDKPVVVTLEGGDLFEHKDGRALIGYRHQLTDVTTRYFARRARRVLVVSKHLGLKLGGIPFDVIPNGVDFSMFYPIDQQVARQALGLPSRKKLVLFGAAPENRVKNYRLAERVCQASSHNPVLVALNGVPHEKVALYMNASDALVITSFREGSPNVLREALACGLPVLSVDVGDVAEQTHAIIGCKVVNSYEPQDLANELDVILSSSKRIQGPIAHLDQKHVTQTHIDIYSNILANSRPSHAEPLVARKN